MFLDSPRRVAISCWVSPSIFCQIKILRQLSGNAASATRTQFYEHMLKLCDTHDFLALPTAQVWPFDAALRWPADVDLALRWYAGQLERLYDDARVRKTDLDQLVRLAAGYPSRERFLTELTLDPPDATSDESGAPSRDEDYMILSTIHSAKGQEWKAVYVLNVVDGCIPSDMSTGTAEEIEEERRLLYVAMTRGSMKLVVCSASPILG